MGIYEKITRNTKQGFTYGASVPLRHVSRFLGRKYHMITMGGTRARIRPKAADLWMFVQIFHNKEYNLASRAQTPRILAAYRKILDDGKVPIIIDAGANVGAASMWFANQFPEALILAIEPDADNAELCRLNTANFPNVKNIEAAIGSEPGSVSLSNPLNDTSGIQTKRSGDGTIPIRTISQLVSDVRRPAKLFLTKIDIEGFEDDLFARNLDWLDETDVMIIEPHDWLLPGKGTSRNFQEAMGKRNFEILISGENLIYARRPQ